MRCAKATPHLHDLTPIIGPPLRRVEATFDAERAGVAASFLEPRVDFVHRRLPAALEWPQWQEAIRDLRRALDSRFGTCADPDRDRLLNWPRVDPSRFDRMELALEADDAFGPEPAHELDLLFEAPCAVLKRNAERGELDRVPANAHAQAQLALGQPIQIGGLLGDEHRLTLRQDNDARQVAQPWRGACQERTEHERFAQVGINWEDSVQPRMIGRVGTHDVVRGDQEVVAEIL